MSDAYESFIRGVHAALLAGALTFVSLACLVAWDLHRHIPILLENANRAVVIVGGASTDLQKTLALERAAATSQIASAQAATVAIAAAGAAAQKAIADVDRDLTDPASGLIPTSTALVAHQDVELLALEEQARGNLVDLDAGEKQLTVALASAATASENAAQLSADPRIREAFDKFNAALDQSNATLAHITSIAASGDRDAQMLENRLREALKPASLAKTAFERLLGIAGPAAQIATAAK